MNGAISCLMIDDDVEDQDLFTAVISETHLPVECVFTTSCDQALEHLRTANISLPDFVFIDWNLGEINGLSCMSRIRELPGMAMSQFVIHSGSLPSRMVAEILNDSNCLYLAKDASIEAEARKLKNILSPRLRYS